MPTNSSIRESILALLDSNPRAVEHAILVLFQRQTSDEQAREDTIHRNHKGFAVSTVSKGSYYARWIQSGHCLSGWHLDNARRIAKLHVRQLVDSAKQKAARRAA